MTENEIEATIEAVNNARERLNLPAAPESAFDWMQNAPAEQITPKWYVCEIELSIAYPGGAYCTYHNCNPVNCP